jgi:predicted dehydrogenase
MKNDRNMSFKKVIRWGILGCGKIAHKFAGDLQLSKTGILKACASRNMDNSYNFAKKYNIEQYFDNYTALVESDEIDIIYIATPHSLHYEHTMLCLTHHKNVLCEKPLTINYRLAKRLFDVAAEKKLFLMEAMWTACLPAIREIKQKIDTGTIGEIRYIRADFGFTTIYNPESRLYNPALAGGSLLDIGIYPLFMSLLLLGYPDTISASGTLAESGTDSECGILLSYSDGSKASLYSTLTCDTDTICEIFGTKGKILIPSRFHEQQEYYITKQNEPQQNVRPGKIGIGYYHEIEHANDCVFEGKSLSELMPPSLTLNLLKLMDAIRNQIGVKYQQDDDIRYIT